MAPILRPFFLALIALAAGLKTAPVGATAFADVVSVQAAGRPGAYTFTVSVRSPDKGCAQYTDWWEVLDASGHLLYRRVLMHSHVAEQPFERSGGPVAVQRDEVVFVRAHMNPGSYGGKVLTGSVAAGFRTAKGTAGLPDHSRTQPLPDGCAFWTAAHSDRLRDHFRPVSSPMRPRLRTGHRNMPISTTLIWRKPCPH